MTIREDPFAKIRTALRKFQRQILVNTFLREPVRILLQDRRLWRRLLDRWGLYRAGAPAKGAAWFHAATEGEMKVALALVRALPKTVPVVMTTNDYRIVEEHRGGPTEVAILPYPFPFALRRFFRRYSPRQLVLVEAMDPRPVFYLHMMERELPTAVVNGRLGEKWLNACGDLLPLFARVHVFGVRGDGDRDQLAGLGIPEERVHLTGEMKFDTTAEPRPEAEAGVQELAGGRPILVAGSTHSDEEPQVLDAFERLGGGGRAMLILAPRFPDQSDRIEELLRGKGLDFVRRSRFPVSGRPAVVLLDTIGELAAVYRLAAAAFVGHSLLPGGHGHNPIEPARFAVPVAAGPNMANFRLLAELFDRAGAWQRVADAEELARTWAAWLDDPELARQIGRRAADLVESQRGLAMARTLELLRPFLDLEDSDGR